MEKIKIDYKKHYGKDVTCYNQTIKVSKDFKKYIIKEVKTWQK